ncbi:Protein of unknown function [Cotesia congregata]|uniref:Uncharacterized protein n=1 Tax=Cotesia congregata TaxID=51543 RepID=A0A8J2HKJ7_COTCN|nr:Protein of unknown function [Cotesia congregata]
MVIFGDEKQKGRLFPFYNLKLFIKINDITAKNKSLTSLLHLKLDKQFIILNKNVGLKLIASRQIDRRIKFNGKWFARAGMNFARLERARNFIIPGRGRAPLSPVLTRSRFVPVIGPLLSEVIKSVPFFMLNTRSDILITKVALRVFYSLKTQLEVRCYLLNEFPALIPLINLKLFQNVSSPRKAVCGAEGIFVRGVQVYFTGETA